MALLAFTVPVLTGKDGETLEAIEAVINDRYLQNGSAFQ